MSALNASEAAMSIWSQDPGQKVEVPKWRLKAWAEHMLEPDRWRHMLFENGRHITNELRLTKRDRLRADRQAARPPTNQDKVSDR